MNTEPDNRLIDDPEFEVLIQDARAIEIDDAWLDAQLDAILDKLGPPPSDGGPSSSGGNLGPGALSSVLKLVTPIAIGVGIYFTLLPSHEPSTVMPNREVSQSTESRMAEPPSIKPKPPKQVAATLEIPSQSALSEKKPSTGNDIEEGPTKKSGLGFGRSDAPPENNASVLPVLPKRLPPRQPAPVPNLGRALDTIERARNLANQGDIDEALALLEPLLSSAYRPEILSARAELAYRFKRYKVSISSLEALLAEPNVSRTQKPDLLRRLGDGYAKMGECGKAILTYRKALRENPGAGAAAAIRAAMVRCH